MYRKSIYLISLMLHHFKPFLLKIFFYNLYELYSKYFVGQIFQHQSPLCGINPVYCIPWEFTWVILCHTQFPPRILCRAKFIHFILSWDGESSERSDIASGNELLHFSYFQQRNWFHIRKLNSQTKLKIFKHIDFGRL